MPLAFLTVMHHLPFWLSQHPLLPLLVQLFPCDLLKYNLKSSYSFEKLHKSFIPVDSILKIVMEKVHRPHFG